MAFVRLTGRLPGLRHGYILYRGLPACKRVLARVIYCVNLIKAGAASFAMAIAAE